MYFIQPPPPGKYPLNCFDFLYVVSISCIRHDDIGF